MGFNWQLIRCAPGSWIFNRSKPNHLHAGVASTATFLFNISGLSAPLTTHTVFYIKQNVHGILEQEIWNSAGFWRENKWNSLGGFGLKTRQVESCIWLRRGVFILKTFSNRILFSFFAAPVPGPWYLELGSCDQSGRPGTLIGAQYQTICQFYRISWVGVWGGGVGWGWGGAGCISAAATFLVRFVLDTFLAAQLLAGFKLELSPKLNWSVPPN